jgi:hypothetical protein
VTTVFELFSSNFKLKKAYSLVGWLFLLVVWQAHHAAFAFRDAMHGSLPLHCHDLRLIEPRFIPYRLARLSHYNFDLPLLVELWLTVSTKQHLRAERLWLILHRLLLCNESLRYPLRSLHIDDLLPHLDKRVSMLASVLEHLLVLQFLLLHLVELVLLEHSLLQFKLLLLLRSRH